MPLTGSVHELFNGTVAADSYTAVLDCRNAVFVQFEILTSGASGFNLTPKVEISMDGVTWTVTTTGEVIVTDGVQYQSYGNTRYATISVMALNMRVFLDHSAGSATMRVRAHTQKDT